MNKRFCKVCGEEINPLRVKALPTAVTCVEHSNAGRKRGRILSLGEGDHNYNEIEILEEDAYIRAQEYELTRGRTTAKTNISLEVLNYDDDEVADDHNALKATARQRVQEQEK